MTQGIGIKLTDRMRFDPNLALYMPFDRMVAGRSPNLLSWNGSAPSTGWSGTRATLSEVTTPTPPVSAKALKVLCNDGAGAGVAHAEQDIGGAYTKYVGITLSHKMWVYVPSTNLLTQALGLYVGTGTTYGSNLAKNDAWTVATQTYKTLTTTGAIRSRCYGKKESDANTTDIVYVDDPVLTVPQCTEQSFFGRVCHPEGCIIGLPFGGKFDGSDDLFTIETDPIGILPVTIVADILLTGAYPVGSANRILDNGKLWLGCQGGGNDRIFLSSDGGTSSYTPTSSFVANTRYRLVATRTAAGIANIFLQGSLSGTANQNSGTPAAGTTLLTVGNRVAGDRAFAGWIKEVRVYTNDIWDAARVARDYAEWRAGL